MIREKLIVTGKVQGVGFRPFVYRVAKRLNLRGYIKNSNIGVEIEIEGLKRDIEFFKKFLIENLPPLAEIEAINIEKLKPIYQKEFKIIESKSKNLILKTVTILPDIAICNDCKLDIFLTSKYKNYFATNCTNCGPRYTIIQTIPYDRVNTSMKNFTLCSSCKKEYNNPIDRRYHAQPTSCINCGPMLSLYSKSNKINTKEIYKIVAEFIKEGKIGVIKGIGGFHIVCDATNEKVVQKLRDYKYRPNKPFAIMCKDIEQIKEFATVTAKEEELLTSKEAPIVVLNKLKNQKKIASNIAPNISKIGCFLPYTALHILLFKHLSNPIVATSANLGGEAIITTKEEIENKLPFIEFILDYNREILNGIDDSVIQVVNNDISILRLARGYTPKEIILDKKVSKKILCVGANAKNSIALLFDNKIIVSPYIGDLDNIESYEFFKRTIKTFKRFYDFKPDIIVHDKHPSYASTIYAKEQNIATFEVQHHIAHIYACMAEYNLKGKYLSFAFDGTGYGDDKRLWGAEIFIGDKREYSFKSIKLLGGTKAIKEPKRVALSMLFDRYSLDEVLKLDFELLKEFTQNEIKLLHRAYSINLNAPLASSIGRLFDGVASFANLCQIQTYEGEAGLLCENAYNKECKSSFLYTITNNNIIEINFDFKDKQIVSKFINTLVNIIIDISKKENLEVILSGGVFQNRTLLELLDSRFKQEDINYYYPKTTTINDGGISLGQAYYYYLNDLK